MSRPHFQSTVRLLIFGARFIDRLKNGKWFRRNSLLEFQSYKEANEKSKATKELTVQRFFPGILLSLE